MSNEYTESEINRSQAMLGAVIGEQEPDPWAYWRNGLEGKIDRASLNESNPQFGYYRIKRGERIVPIAWWPDSHTGELRCHLDGKDYDVQKSRDLWQWAGGCFVSAEAYAERVKTGKWPGESAAVVGHNAAPPDDSVESIAASIEDLAREAERLIKAGAATSEDVSDQASDVANTLGELESKVARLHKDEKEPHLEAGRTVDRKWFRLRDRAADLKRRLKAIVVTPFLAKQKAEIMAANVAAISAGTAPEALPQQRVTAGSSKRQTALRTHYRAEVEDKAKLIESLKDHPKILACAQEIADAAAKQKIALPGCRVIAEQKAA